ncbi:MAG: ATP synthase F1 subunit delta [Bacteroidia bacterium]
MRESRVSYRYAKSLLDLALEKGQLEDVRNDMLLVNNTIRGSHELGVLLRSPVIKTDKKQAILKALFGNQVTAISAEFMDIITRKRREGELEGISNAFLSQYKKHKNILTAVITTSQGLDASLRQQVLDIVRGTTKSEVVLEEKIDASLIGGFVLRVGDQQVDASILRQIRNLERNFSENPYIKEI